MTMNRMNPALLKELQGAEKSKFEGAIIVEDKDTPLTGRIFFHGGGIYAVQIDGFYPRIVARMASSGVVDVNREEHLKHHFAGNLLDPGIGTYVVRDMGWISVDDLSEYHQEFILAALGALLTLQRVKVKKHKNESTDLFCTIPLPLDKVLDTLSMRLRRFNNTWVPISPNPDPNSVVPVIVNPAALAGVDHVTARAIAQAIDGRASVDQVAARCGRTRAEAVHLLALMVSAGAVQLNDMGPQPFDKDALWVPELAGTVVVTGITDAPMEGISDDDITITAGDLPGEVFGEGTEMEAEFVAPPAGKKRRGFFGFGKKKKDEADEEVVFEEVEVENFNTEEWVAPEHADAAYAAHEFPEFPESELMGEPLTEEIAIVEEPVYEEVVPEPVYSQPQHLLATWATGAEGEKRGVRLSVLARMVEQAQKDVEEKTALLARAEAELQQAHADLANAEEAGRVQRSLREASANELAALENVRNQAQAELDAAVEELSGLQNEMASKDAEIGSLDAEIARLTDLINQARGRIDQIHGEKAELSHAIAQKEQVRAERVDRVADSSLRVTEFANGPHAEALAAEAAAFERINGVKSTLTHVEQVRVETEQTLRVAKDVLDETVLEAEEAARLS